MPHMPLLEKFESPMSVLSDWVWGHPMLTLLLFLIPNLVMADSLGSII